MNPAMFFNVILFAVSQVLHGAEKLTAERLGIISLHTNVFLRLNQNLQLVAVAQTEQPPTDENLDNFEVVYHAMSKEVLCVFPVHVHWKAASSVHTEESMREIISLVEAVVVAIADVTNSDEVAVITVSLAGDWNNCAVPKTDCGPDVQGMNTPCHLSDAQKTQKGVVGQMVYQYTVATAVFVNMTPELQPKSFPTRQPVIETPGFQLDEIQKIVENHPHLEPAVKEIVELIFSWILPLFTCGDHPLSVATMPKSEIRVAIQPMLGFGKNGFNVDPLYGMFLRDTVFHSLLRKHYELSTKKVKGVAFKIQEEIGKKVCDHLGCAFSAHPFKDAKNFPIFAELFAEQSAYGRHVLGLS